MFSSLLAGVVGLILTAQSGMGNMDAGNGYELNAVAASVIGGRDAEVLVYCRSGSRSKQAAAMLARLGYTNICEFGGIMTWPYEVTAE